MVWKMRLVTKDQWDKMREIIPYEADPLEPSEEGLLLRSIKRQFTSLSRFRVIRDIYIGRLPEIAYFVGVMKKQFNAKFMGEFAVSGGFCIKKPHAGYFGYDTWFDKSLTGGTLNNWIDNDTPDHLSSGSAAEMTIGDPAGHLILYIGTYAQSPVSEIFKFTKNGKALSAVNVQDEFAGSEMKIHILDTPIALVGGDVHDTFRAQIYAGKDGVDSPYLGGITCLKAEASRIYDPADMAGTARSKIAVQ